uniref:Uncharacterized protein n=1 Tax=viral metagenome TaxID=1070528 RepID=A0A6M3J7G6_9ZZZZ
MASKTFYPCGCMEQGDQFFACSSEHRNQPTVGRVTFGTATPRQIAALPNTALAEAVRAQRERDVQKCRDVARQYQAKLDYIRAEVAWACVEAIKREG